MTPIDFMQIPAVALEDLNSIRGGGRYLHLRVYVNAHIRKVPTS